MLTKNEINMAEELTEKLRNQGELIAKVLCDMTRDEFFECVEFLPSPDGDKGIAITIHNGGFGTLKTRVEWFPEEYLSKSEDELVVELYHRREEEKRRKEAEKLAEKEDKALEEEEARKERYQMFLELKSEFEGTEDTSRPAISGWRSDGNGRKHCLRGKCGPEECEFYDKGVCTGIVYPTYPPKYDYCEFFRN